MHISTVYMGIIAPSFIVLPIVVAVSKINYWKVPERLSFFYLVISGTFNIIAKVTANFHINNLPFLHLYTVIEFCLLCAFFRSLTVNEHVRKLLGALMILFPFIALSYIFLTHALFSYNVLPRFLSSILLLSFCIYYLVSNLNSTAHNYRAFGSTIVMALLLYFSSSSALFALIEYVRKNNGLSFLWNLHATFVLVMYLIFTVAFFNLKKT